MLKALQLKSLYASIASLPLRKPPRRAGVALMLVKNDATLRAFRYSSECSLCAHQLRWPYLRTGVRAARVLLHSRRYRFSKLFVRTAMHHFCKIIIQRLLLFLSLRKVCQDSKAVVSLGTVIFADGRSHGCHIVRTVVLQRQNSKSQWRINGAGALSRCSSMMHGKLTHTGACQWRCWNYAISTFLKLTGVVGYAVGGALIAREGSLMCNFILYGKRYPHQQCVPRSGPDCDAASFRA